LDGVVVGSKHRIARWSDQSPGRIELETARPREELLVSASDDKKCIRVVDSEIGFAAGSLYGSDTELRFARLDAYATADIRKAPLSRRSVAIVDRFIVPGLQDC
jgi:hypothetical protein